MFIWLTLNPFRPKWCFKNFELNFINYRCCMHEYIKKLQTEALKFLLSEYFFFKYTFTRPISFLDQKSVRRSSNIFCIYSYVKFEPPSWPNPTPKIMIMSVKSSDYTCTCNRCVIVSQFTGSQSILKLLNNASTSFNFPNPVNVVWCVQSMSVFVSVCLIVTSCFQPPCTVGKQ